MKTESQTAQNF